MACATPASTTGTSSRSNRSRLASATAQLTGWPPKVMPFAQALIDAGPDRVLWGSDWPHVVFDGFMPNDADLLDLLALWAPDAELRRKILVDNPAQLYGF